MEMRIDEIAGDIYRLSTFVPEIAPPAGFTFNHFLVVADEPLLFHCGLRAMFPRCRLPSPELFPSSGSAGSRLAMSKPTSAGP